MRGRKGRIDSSGAVIGTAMYMGLAALVRIIQNRSSKKTRRYVKSIEKMWTAAKRALEQASEQMKLGFSPIQTAEPNMRGQFFKFAATSLRRFGNRELKRIYNWMEGAVGPFNALLNYAGARLRELAMFCYPFPRPQAFQIREYPDGSVKVLTKEQADSMGDDGAIRVYWRYGYERKGKMPRVFLTHPTMPGMDFVDMIRAHCVELCRQCFRYQVPVTEAHRYIRLLIHQLRPFLDWVYTDGQEGRKGFNRYADHELRKIVLEIRALYTKQSSRRTRISKQHAESPLSISLQTIREQVSSQLETVTDAFERARLECFRDYLNEETGVLQERDIEKLADQVLGLSEREGNQWHRVLFSDLHHPTSLRQVVFAGDTLLDDVSPLMIVAELPVGNYAGKADLTVFIRRMVDRKTRWTPIMVLEVKTKTAFDFNLYGIRLKRKGNCSIVPALYAWKRMTSEEEWEEILGSGPDSDALAQLGAYEHEIVTEYRELAPDDQDPPSSLWKGVIVLDTSEPPSDIFSAFQYLLNDLRTKLIQQIIGMKTPISVIPEYAQSHRTAPKVALFVEPSNGPARLLEEMEPPERVPAEDPFIEREPDDRTLSIYVSVPSPTSAGVTAARLARGWHLLHHINECCKISQEPIEVVWLDMMGDYKSDILAQKRLRLDILRSKGQLAEDVHVRLTRLLQKIRYVDLSLSCADIISEGEKGIGSLFAALSAVFPTDRDIERIIILDGWTGFRDMMPAHRQPLLRAIEQRLLDSLPQAKTNIIWIDDGVLHTRMNRMYQRECISPLRFDSPRRSHLDEIIYNLPTPPRKFWWLHPQAEDVRVIVQDTPTRTEPWTKTIHVPQLTGVTDMFKGSARRDGIVPLEVVLRDHARPMYGKGVKLSSISLACDSFPDNVTDNALTLVPSVLRERDTAADVTEPEQQTPDMASAWQSVVQEVRCKRGTRMSERMRVDVTRPPPRPKGSDRFVDTLGRSVQHDKQGTRITRAWRYDLAPKQFPDEENEKLSVTHPPLAAALDVGEIDTIKTRERELRRLLSAARHLLGQSLISGQLKSCCVKIEQYCARELSLVREEPSLRTPEFFLGALRHVQKILLQDDLTREVWDHLVPLRQGLIHLLNSENRESMKDTLAQLPDLFLLYGNSLFLAVLAVADGPEGVRVEILWNAVAEWTFYQLGLTLQDESVRTVYSFQAILTNLRSRVTALADLSLPKSVSTKEEQVGAIYWQEDDAAYDGLLMFPKEEGRFLTCIVQGLRNRWLGPGWHSCKSTPQQLRAFAKSALSSPDPTAVIAIKENGKMVLQIPVEDEIDDSIGWTSFVIEHGKPSGRYNAIPWLMLEDAIPQSTPTAVPAIPDAIPEHLSRMARIKHIAIPVRLIVAVNKELEVYEVDLDGKDFSERLEFSRTDELVRFLRTPVWSGAGYRTQRRVVTWDHIEDIEYVGGLSFLMPLVHRSRFHQDEYHYPVTCRELLHAGMGGEVSLVVVPDGTGFRVELPDIPSTSCLKELECVSLSKSTLGLLAECEELYDVNTRIFHPVKLDITAIMDVIFWGIHRYPRLQEALDTAEEQEFDWSQDVWEFSGHFTRGNEIVWSIRSKRTGREWRDRTFSFQVRHDQTPDELLAELRHAIASVVPLKWLDGVEELLDVFRRTMVDRGWRLASIEDEDVYEEPEEWEWTEEAGRAPEVARDVFLFAIDASTTIDVHMKGDSIVLSLGSEHGDIQEVCVVENVPGLREISRATNGIARGEILGVLESFGHAGGRLDEITELVEDLLVAEGVVFYED